MTARAPADTPRRPEPKPARPALATALVLGTVLLAGVSSLLLSVLEPAVADGLLLAAAAPAARPAH